MAFLENIYASSPVFLQNVIISAYGYQLKRKRYGKLFYSTLKELKERENYTKQEFRDYQTVQLRKLLVHAFNNVKFYNEKYKKHGFLASSFQKFEIEDLEKLPFLEKEDLRKFGTTSLLSSKKKKGSFISTGGSTGTPAKIFYSNEFYQIWAAVYEARVRNWAGLNKNQRRGMIGGRKIIEDSDAKPPFYRYNFAEKQTYFSAYHISENNLESYVDGILKHKVEYMVGYALSNFFLADFIVKNNIKIPTLEGVLTSSEKLTDEMRETFKKAYGCKTFDAYSGVEACGLISENLYGDFLWSEDVGIAEVTKDNELVSTGLLNFDQPLIRYKIGDNIKISKNQSTNSGLEMLKIDEVFGRVEDTIFTKEGKRIISLYRLFLDIPFLKMAQVEQFTFNKFDINVVVENGFSEVEEKIISKRFFEKIGKDVNLKINRVSDIERTKSGKYKLTISHL